MLKVDKDALVCDLAETYGIYNWRSLPISLVATFSAGLRDDSRIKLKMSGQELPLRDLLIAGIFDYTALLVWSKTKDAERNRNRPESILKSILQTDKGDNDEVMKYASGEDFVKDRMRILAKIENGERNGN